MKDIYRVNLVPYFRFTKGYNCIAGNLRTNESNFGNLTCDIINILNETDFTTILGGHIRSETFYPKDTVIKRIDILKLYPFTEPTIIL